MRVAVVVLTLSAAACGRVGFDPLDGDGATNGDGATTGEAGINGEAGVNGEAGIPGEAGTGGVIQCTASAGSVFPGGSPCGDWGASGISNGSSSLSETGGALVITPTPNITNAGSSCTRQLVTFGTGGVEVEVSSVLAGASNVTGVAIGSGGTRTYQAYVRNGRLRGEGPSGFTEVIYDPVDMRWFRLVPNPPRVDIETSPDGATWTFALGLIGTATSQYDITIFATEVTATAAPGTARFETIRHCP